MDLTAWARRSDVSGWGPYEALAHPGAHNQARLREARACVRPGPRLALWVSKGVVGETSWAGNATLEVVVGGRRARLDKRLRNWPGPRGHHA